MLSSWFHSIRACAFHLIPTFLYVCLWVYPFFMPSPPQSGQVPTNWIQHSNSPQSQSSKRPISLVESFGGLYSLLSLVYMIDKHSTNLTTSSSKYTFNTIKTLNTGRVFGENFNFPVQHQNDRMNKIGGQQMTYLF